MASLLVALPDLLRDESRDHRFLDVTNEKAVCLRRHIALPGELVFKIEIRPECYAFVVVELSLEVYGVLTLVSCSQELLQVKQTEANLPADSTVS